MNKCHFDWAALPLALALATGCEDPAKGKPRAEVTAANESAAAKPAGSNLEQLTLSSDSSKLNWVGSKVSGSHDGSFQKFTGTLYLADGKAEGGKIELVIDTTSIEADKAKLTRHLRSPDFFDVNTYPQATFTSTKIAKTETAGATHTISGTLDLHGTKKSITFPVKISVTASEVTATSEFSLNRKDFGINYQGMANDLIRDDVVIKIDIKVARQAS